MSAPRGTHGRADRVAHRADRLHRRNASTQETPLHYETLIILRKRAQGHEGEASVRAFAGAHRLCRLEVRVHVRRAGGEEGGVVAQAERPLPEPAQPALQRHEAELKRCK